MYNFIADIVEETAPSLEEMILNMKVEWYPLVDGMGVDAGDVVQWSLPYASLTKVLAVGLPGLVMEVDTDGNVHVFFPALRTTSLGSHWIDKVGSNEAKLCRSVCTIFDGIWRSHKHDKITVTKGRCTFGNIDEQTSQITHIGGKIFVNGWETSERSWNTIVWSKAGQETWHQASDLSGGKPALANEDRIIRPAAS